MRLRILTVVAACASIQAVTPSEYWTALQKIDFEAVRADIRTTLTQSQAWWPADYGNYGPFFIRLAWHCAGSYRISDGRGGCGGGRQRFDPERSWEDNTNLDKARRLLQGVKTKYGVGLSWGDLIILTGDVAIEQMGGPVLGFCAGRIDDEDGAWSAGLGPSGEQERHWPCELNGNCTSPLGPTTVGLIYVNPEGPMGVPNPNGSFPQIRDTFGRMSMNDSETVALIGGGHAFGKTHGACPDGPGLPPRLDPVNPWPGNCGTGRGNDTFTSGFEGPWTSTPIAWSNAYFHNLLDHTWEVHQGPGAHNQWRVPLSAPDRPTAPDAHNPALRQDLMMLTSDVSLLSDPSYNALVRQYASDNEKLRHDFAHAWYKLTTRDMGPWERCHKTTRLPPAQPWQFPVVQHDSAPDWNRVRARIRRALIDPIPTIIPPDFSGGNAWYGAMFISLAYQSASTFRVTDFLGGVNGGRMRFSPQKDWPSNAAMEQVIALLQPVWQQNPMISWGDLFVLAAQLALEQSGGKPLAFCPGRGDAPNGDGGSDFLAPRPSRGSLTNFTYTFDEIRESARLMGLTTREYIVLQGRPRSRGVQARLGFIGSWSTTPDRLSNEYFRVLLTEEWQPTDNQFKAVNKDLFMVKHDVALRLDPEFLSIAQDFASDNELFLTQFAAAWTKLINADRFQGPTGNLCSTAASDPSSSTRLSTGAVIGIGFGGLILGALLGYCMRRAKSEMEAPLLNSHGR